MKKNVDGKTGCEMGMCDCLDSSPPLSQAVTVNRLLDIGNKRCQLRNE